MGRGVLRETVDQDSEFAEGDLTPVESGQNTQAPRGIAEAWVGGVECRLYRFRAARRREERLGRVGFPDTSSWSSLVYARNPWKKIDDDPPASTNSSY